MLYICFLFVCFICFGSFSEAPLTLVATLFDLSIFKGLTSERRVSIYLLQKFCCVLSAICQELWWACYVSYIIESSQTPHKRSTVNNPTLETRKLRLNVSNFPKGQRCFEPCLSGWRSASWAHSSVCSPFPGNLLLREHYWQDQRNVKNCTSK